MKDKIIENQFIENKLENKIIENQFIDMSNIIIDTEYNKPNNRCPFITCNKKLRISDLECRCGKIFCSQHKFPEDHKCEHDYKDRSKRDKSIEEMKCKSNKVQKI